MLAITHKWEYAGYKLVRRCSNVALTPLAPLSQLWERGEPGSPPLILGEGLGEGASLAYFQFRQPRARLVGNSKP